MSPTRAPRPADSYQRYQPWRRWVEAGFCLLLVVANAAGNSVTKWIDLERSDPGRFQAWEPAAWEWSSAVVWLLLLPVIAWGTRRFPTHWDNWRLRLPQHLLASVVVSLLHVLAMVGIRILAYRTQGAVYDPGPWGELFWYEYLKDVRVYALVVVVFESYRLLLRRMQGEASVLGAADDEPPPAAPERSERFLVRKLGREFLVSASDIEWLQASGNYVNLRVRGHDYPLRSTMAAIEAQLDPARFARIHRSHIVNLDQVASIEPLDTGDARVHMADGSVLPCSRRQRDALRGRAAC